MESSCSKASFLSSLWNYPKSGICFLLGSAILVKVFLHLKMNRKVKRAIHQEKRKRDENLALIKESLLTSDLTVEKRSKILAMDIEELQKALQTRALKALEVLQAFQSKALEAHEMVNCIVQPIMEAEEFAKACDSSEKILGPLHGIPISIKENIIIKGHRVTCGIAKGLFNEVNKEDSIMVKMLKSLGAVPFVRTNVPQSLLSCGCDNNIYGPTGNPHDPKRSAGGSSGGEGALIGCNGSILGIGTDIGGSIRIPTHYCGIYGLKPTSKRLNSSSSRSAIEGQTLLPTSMGPMGRNTNSLIVFMKALLTPSIFKMDSLIPPIPFQTELFESKEKLRIGFYLNDPMVTASPASQRAVLLAKQLLEANGHTVVEFIPPRLDFAIKLGSKILMQDGKVFSNTITNESPIIPIKPLKLTEGKRRFLAPLVYLYDSSISSNLYNLKGVGSTKEWYQISIAKREYCKEFQRAWKSQNLDAVICPSMASATPIHDKMFFAGIPTYTLPYNLLDYPAGVLPVTKVTKTDCQQHADYKPKNLPEKFIQNLMKGVTDLPIGVQCVAPPYREEVVLRLMKELEEALKKDHAD